MNGLRRHHLRFVKKVVSRNGVNYPVYDSALLGMNSVTRFSGSLMMLKNLNGMQQVFLHYLTEIMDGNNRVSVNLGSRSDFIRYMSSDGSDPLSDKYVSQMVKPLVSLKLLLPSGKRSEYYVNPLYFTRDSEKRKSLVTKLFEIGVLELT